jgi:hypothetical protein
MGEDAMTDPGQLDQPEDDSSEQPQEAHELSHDIQQPTRRFSLPRNRSAWIGITVSLIALAGVTVALIAVATGGGTHQANSAATGGPSAATGTAPGSSAPGAAPGSNKASQAHNGVSKAKTNVISAAQLAQSGGALSLPSNAKNLVLAWQAGRGGADLATVSRQAGTALQSGGIRQYTMMKNACGQLAGGVPTAQAGPPIPVAAMQTLYAKALAELAKGAADCRAAISTTPNGDETTKTSVNTTMLHQSTSELATGANDIFRATAQIEIASRQHH